MKGVKKTGNGNAYWLNSIQHAIPLEFTLAATPSATDGALSISEEGQALGAE
jgi:hypothetical protein